MYVCMLIILIDIVYLPFILCREQKVNEVVEDGYEEKRNNNHD